MKHKKDRNEQYEYDRESDLLDVYFGEKRAAWTIELTEHIPLSLDRETGQAVSLSFLDFSELSRPAPLGLKSFPLTGLADLPHVERERVMRALTTNSVKSPPGTKNWCSVLNIFNLKIHRSFSSKNGLEMPLKRAIIKGLKTC